jgi:hypothetical protein
MHIAAHSGNYYTRDEPPGGDEEQLVTNGKGEIDSPLSREWRDTDRC